MGVFRRVVRGCLHPAEEESGPRVQYHKKSLSPSVDADISAGTDLLGRSVTDLQEGITIGTDSISGTLHYITGWFEYDVVDIAKSRGNYLALHIVGPAGMTVALSGGDDPVAVEGDIYVFHITDPAAQTIVITYGNSSQSIDLGGVTNG